MVAPALARFSQSHPDIQVEVIVGSADVYNDLATGKCDIVVGDRGNYESSPHAQSIRMQPLSDEPLVAVYRQGHPVHLQADLASLLTFPWAIPSRYFVENLSLRGLANRVNSRGFPQYRRTSLSACLILAASSDSIALVPLTVALSDAAKGLVHHDLGLNLHVGLALFTLARVSPAGAVRAFLDTLRTDQVPA